MNETSWRNQGCDHLITEMIEHELEAAREARLPHRTMRPIRVFTDGDQWCFLFGENLQEGVVGFGDSPETAAMAFDRAWYQKLPTARPADVRDSQEVNG